MRVSELQKVLDSFGGFDGAVVQMLAIDNTLPLDQRSVCVQLKAFSQTPGQNNWKIVKVIGKGRPIFGWVETTRESNVVPNYPVSVIEFDGMQIIDFDPLHASANPIGIKLSACFVGGSSISIEVAGN